MYTLAIITDHCSWKQDCKCHRARQAEKKILKSHFQKQGKASTSGTVTAPQNKANLSLATLSAKNSSSKSSLFSTPKKQLNTPWMDLSSKLTSNNKLTSNECKKHLKNNLCLYCSAGDYKLDSCPKKQTLLRIIVLQQLLILWQLLLRNPQKNRERPPGLCTD